MEDTEKTEGWQTYKSARGRERDVKDTRPHEGRTKT